MGVFSHKPPRAHMAESPAQHEVISYSEALRPFIGAWGFDAKKSKDIPGSVSSERIMKKAKVPLTKRLGLQYFVGNDVTQLISIDEETGEVHVEAFVKGIPSWEKVFYLDQRKVAVKDPLFGGATAHSFYDPKKKELHYILDSNKKEKGRLSFIRTVEDDTLTLYIRWFPSSDDETIYITHQRKYTRKGSQFSLGEILQKKRVKSCLSNSVSKPMGEINKLGNRLRRNTSEVTKKTAEQENTPEDKPAESRDLPTLTKANSSILSKPTSEISPPVGSESQLEPLWKSLVLPLSAFFFSILVFIICTKLG